MRTDTDGWLPLHYAAQNGHTAVVQQLLAAAAEAAMHATQDGMLPLHVAAQNGHTAVVLQLLAADAGTAMQADIDGWLPLHFAAINGHTAVVQQLLAAAAETAKQADARGWLPLHRAAPTGDIEMVQQLLDAFPRAAMLTLPDGRLPLHLAAVIGHTSVVQLLLDAAPEAAMQATQAGQLPLQLALLRMRNGDSIPHSAAARLLLRAAAAPRELDLSNLHAAGPDGLQLLADFVAARVPLSTAEWELIPAPCPGILCALPAALTRSADQARKVVQRLSCVDAVRLRTALQCLHVAQRRCGVFLLHDLVLNILQLACDPGS
jgi:ankyrin repeat protein